VIIGRTADVFPGNVDTGTPTVLSRDSSRCTGWTPHSPIVLIWDSLFGAPFAMPPKTLLFAVFFHGRPRFQKRGIFPRLVQYFQSPGCGNLLAIGDPDDV
jgi:hypothetical protein